MTHSGKYQDFFEDGFDDAFHLSRALKSGLRGNELIPALLDDFRVWQTCPPDRYAPILQNGIDCLIQFQMGLGEDTPLSFKEKKIS
jgi:hypothetical protein